jgi:poly[(R)-3-hydroxyalkanoate] polymerase subunit PhaC
VPLLVVPPTINKFYVLDLAPGRSLVEHLLDEGQQVFMISWRNPQRPEGHFDLDTYAGAVLEARAAVAEITRQPSVHVAAACSGGIISACAVAHLAAQRRLAEVASLTLLVCALDNASAGTVSALASRELAAAAVAESARKGYLDGQALAGVFAWLRPNDLIWTYWVNNYLLGRKPPAFDILFWNADTTRMSATLHADFVDVAMDNRLVRPAATMVRGVPIELSEVGVDTYVVAGIADHLTPWQSCYRSTQLLGGTSRFILSTSGHIAALVNPPGNPKATYQINDENPADADTWLKGAETRQGSWWPDLVAWLRDRSGAAKRAPTGLGCRGMRPLVDAPGTYVFDS